MNENRAVRDLHECELEDLVALEGQCFNVRQWGRSKIEESFRDRKTKIRVASEVNGELLGFCVHRVFPPEAEILTIGVGLSFRGQGVAKALIKDLIVSAKNIGVTKVYLEVDEENSGAITLYKMMGFIETGVRQGYYRDGANARLMECQIL